MIYNLCYFQVYSKVLQLYKSVINIYHHSFFRFLSYVGHYKKRKHPVKKINEGENREMIEEKRI